MGVEADQLYSGSLQVIAESFRDRKDIFNGAFGGLAGGLVLGIRAGKISFGLGAAAALPAASMGVEVSGGRMRGPSGFGDGAVPNKKFIGEEI